MGLLDIFKRHSGSSGPQILKSSPTDDFAEGIVLELKTVINAAVGTALDEIEGHYLKAVLLESQFSLDSLVIRALDAETMRRLEDFLSRHERHIEGYRESFLRQLVPVEYRSTRGSTVVAAPNLFASVTLEPAHLDDLTEDESYMVNLKGRKIRFEAHAVLGGPHRKPASARGPAPAAAESVAGSVGARWAQAPAEAGPPPAAALIRLQIEDARGQRSLDMPLPVLLGRAQREGGQDEPLPRVDIDAVYVSRRQLMVFEVFGQPYVAVPAQASLSCRTVQGLVLERERMYRLEPGVALRLVTGAAADQPGGVLPTDQPSQYAHITVEIAPRAAAHEGTPRPRAVG